MSDQNQVIDVQASSLPRCMRHLSKSFAADEALYIAKFLKEVVEDCSQDREQHSSDFYSGMSLVFDVLMDKIEYGAGRLPFPNSAAFNDAPTLQELLEAGWAALKEREGARHD